MACNRQDKNSALRFFKIITTTVLQTGKLKLPHGFTRKYGGDVSNPVNLKPPDDKEWKIYWTREDGCILFERGWAEFASYYSLDHGNLVLFGYNTASHFEVHIFDKTTLEIDYTFHESRDEHDNLDQILNERPTCKKRKLKSPMSCPQPSKKMRDGTSGNVGRNSRFPNSPLHAEENVGGSSLECLKRKELTSKASNRARTFTSKNPSFEVVMKPAYLSSYMYVPSSFAKNHLKDKQSDIILDVMDGRTWHAHYFLGISRIGSGWNKFVSDNNLKVGDVCCFELTKSQPLSFKVSISRLGGNPPPQESVQEDGVNGFDTRTITDVESETTITRKGRKGKATQRTSKPNSPRFFTNEALNQANEFTPENPYFTINIEPNNRRGYRQEVPVAFVRNYFNRKQCLMLEFEKRQWPVKLDRYPQLGTCKLFKGWAKFVRENKLVGGDVCVFELTNREVADVPVLDVQIFKGLS